jgi:UDP-N-acetylmuramoyl-tripeptide--D-alanyl-D-alanine ligase
MYISDLLKNENVTVSGPDMAMPLSISIDSRTMKEGQIFLALKGSNTDGHAYIEEALNRGASGVILQRGCADISRIPSSVTCIQTEDTFKFTADLARAYLNKTCPDQIIAITGSVGKTSTREITRKLLVPEYKVHSPVSSFNTLLGCSLTILAMPIDTEILLLEMGTNSPGEIQEMSEFFEPTSAVITDVREAHLEGLGDLSGVLRAKMEILSSSRLSNFFFNSDNHPLRSALHLIPDSIRKIGVGEEFADFRIISPEFSLKGKLPELKFTYSFKDVSIEISSALFGMHQARCLAIAAAIAIETGVALESIIKKARKIASKEGRGRFLQLSDNGIIIDDCYNANPASLSAALETVADLAWKGRKLAILGGMRELGSSEGVKHIEILPYLRPFDQVVLVGDEWTFLKDQENYSDGSFTVKKTAEEALAFISSQLSESDLILVKGSHSYRLDKVIEGLVNRE